MRLPSGVSITAEDLAFISTQIQRSKPKVNSHNGDCWYCGNGQDRKLIEAGLCSYHICDCGASIVELPKRKTRKAMPHAKLAKEVAAILARNYNPTVARRYKTKAFI